MAKKIQQNQIVLENFLRMNPQAPQFSDKNQHYLISNCDPLYYLSKQVQEENIAPLAAAGNLLGNLSLGVFGNYTEVIDSGNIPTYEAIGVTSTGYVFEFNTSSSKSLYSYTPVVSMSDSSARLALFNQNIVFSYSGTTLYYTNALSGTSWSSSTPGLLDNDVVHYMEPFGKYLCISDAGRVWQLQADNTFSNFYNYIDVYGTSAGWQVMRMCNYNNKYLAIATTLNSSSIVNSYLALWDGIQTVAPNYAIKISGIFQDMYVDKNGVLNVLVQERLGQSALYYLDGTVLKRSQSIQVDTVSLSPWGTGAQGEYIYGNNLFSYAGLLGVRLSSKGALLLGQTDVGQAEYILNNTTFDFPSNIPPSKIINCGEGNLYFAAGGGVWSYDTSKYNNILYYSQWIPIHNPSRIDIWYDTPPQITGDSIILNVYGRGEDFISSMSSVNGVNCQYNSSFTITPANILNQRRTMVNLDGFEGDEILIELRTTIKLRTTLEPGSSWIPIIRKIVIT